MGFSQNRGAREKNPTCAVCKNNRAAPAARFGRSFLVPVVGESNRRSFSAALTFFVVSSEVPTTESNNNEDKAWKSNCGGDWMRLEKVFGPSTNPCGPPSVRMTQSGNISPMRSRKSCRIYVILCRTTRSSRSKLESTGYGQMRAPCALLSSIAKTPRFLQNFRMNTTSWSVCSSKPDYIGAHSEEHLDCPQGEQRTTRRLVGLSPSGPRSILPTALRRGFAAPIFAAPILFVMLL